MKSELNKHNASHGFTKVIFRKWQIKDGGEIIALFPEIPGDMSPATCSSYEHIGQHGAADYNGVVFKTQLAKPIEYTELKLELESLGYCLDVKKRATARDYASRLNELNILERY